MTNLLQRARELRAVIETMAGGLPDTEALSSVELFPAWDGNGHEYTTGDRVRDGGVLYKCLQAHTSQSTWQPSVTPSLWTRVLIPDPEVIPEWVQPDSTNPYMTGDKVTHNGKTWVSTCDHNVWEPGIYGWEEVS